MTRNQSISQSRLLQPQRQQECEKARTRTNTHTQFVEEHKTDGNNLCGETSRNTKSDLHMATEIIRHNETDSARHVLPRQRQASGLLFFVEVIAGRIRITLWIAECLSLCILFIVWYCLMGDVRQERPTKGTPTMHTAMRSAIEHNNHNQSINQPVYLSIKANT